MNVEGLAKVPFGLEKEAQFLNLGQGRETVKVP